MTVGIIRTFLSTSLIIGLSLAFFSNQALALVAESEVDARVTTETEAEAQAEAEARPNMETDPIVAPEEARASASEKRAAMQEQVTERKAALQARTQERVTNLAANMSNRMEAVIARLENISSRLESRIDKMNEAGIDTAASAQALASARVSLDSARAEISDIDASVFTAVSATDARAGWTTLKAKFSTIRDLIKAAHSELRNSLSFLKEASLEARAQQNTDISSE